MLPLCPFVQSTYRTNESISKAPKAHSSSQSTQQLLQAVVRTSFWKNCGALKILPTSCVWKGPTFPNLTPHLCSESFWFVLSWSSLALTSFMLVSMSAYLFSPFPVPPTNCNTWTDLWSFRYFCIANKSESAWRRVPCSERMTHNRAPIRLLWGRLTMSLPLSTELLTPECSSPAYTLCIATGSGRKHIGTLY